MISSSFHTCMLFVTLYIVIKFGIILHLKKNFFEYVISVTFNIWITLKKLVYFKISPFFHVCMLLQPIDEKLPSFEGFIVEAVEGSGMYTHSAFFSEVVQCVDIVDIYLSSIVYSTGGYGTVYKAMSKVDGKLRAIKCECLLIVSKTLMLIFWWHHRSQYNIFTQNVVSRSL